MIHVWRIVVGAMVMFGLATFFFAITYIGSWVFHDLLGLSVNQTAIALLAIPPLLVAAYGIGGLLIDAHVHR